MLMYWSLDFTNDIIGSFYIDPNQEAPVEIVEGAKSELAVDGPHFWWALYGNNGAVLQAIDLDDEIVDYFKCGCRWRQDPKPKLRKGDHPGKLDIGFGCSESDKIPDFMSYHWQNYILFPEDPSPKGTVDLKKIFEHPLKITVKNLED